MAKKPIEKIYHKNDSSKILIFHRPSGYGGAEVYLNYLVISLIDQGYLVYICFGVDGNVPQGYKATLETYGARIIDINFDLTYKSNLFDVPKILNWIAKINPKLVLFCRFGNWREYQHVISLLWLKRVRMITIEHNERGSWPIYPARRFPPVNLHLRDLFEKLKCYMLSRMIDNTICMNDLARQRLVSEYNFPIKTTQVIYNGVDVDKFVFNAIVREKVRKKLHLDANSIMILSIGRHSYEKGMDILLEAIFMLSTSYRNRVTFFFVGDGPQHNALKQQSSLLGLSDCVKFLGFRSDVPELLWASDIFISPSRNESFGISVAEAMAASRCVIATEVGGVPELLGKAGILVIPESALEIAHAISNAIDNAQLRKDMGKKAFQRVRDFFDINITINKTFNLISGMLE